MRPSFILGLAAATLVAATPLRGQEAEAEASTWELSGLRAAFCMQLLLDPASELMQQLPTGITPFPPPRPLIYTSPSEALSRASRSSPGGAHPGSASPPSTASGPRTICWPTRAASIRK